MFENIFETVNSGFAQALYEEYLKDPDSVPEEWRELFDSGVVGVAPADNGAGEDDDTDSDADAETATVRQDGESQQREKKRAEEEDSDQKGEPIKGPALRLLQNMEASLSVPTATSFRDIDVSRLWAYRAAMNRELKPRGLKLSFTHLIGWALVRASEEYPGMLHTVVDGDDGPRRFDPKACNLGLAVDVERKDGSRGLLVPIIRNAGDMSFDEYHEEYERLVAGARDGKLMPDEYSGGTITLTNPGTIGTVASVPRLMRGQGSIIATGAIRTIAGQRIMTMTSTYDHRIIQGAVSGMFLQRVDELLQGEEEFYEEVARSLGIGVSNVDLSPPAPETQTAAPAAVAAGGVVPASADPQMLYHVAAAMSLVKSHRTHGHLAARLDPLGTEPPGDPALDPDRLGLTPEVMRQIPTKVLRTYVTGETLADALPRLRETYCGTIAYEIEHISDHEARVWLRQVIESGEHRRTLSVDERKELLRELTRVDRLESFLHKAYLGHKRFGIEGLDAMVPMLKRAARLAREQGASEVVMGMAHRGRLNVLTHVIGRPYETLLAEFEGGREVEETLAPRGGTGDVKYHHGADGQLQISEDDSIRVSLMPNPSHLEAVDPVVEGNARALQTDRGTPDAKHDPRLALPLLIHGDAAFAAQGVVAETFNLARLRGYSTGGTLHIIANNQIGFTTKPKDARSTEYASDLALGFDIPIIHVNADDPEACLAAINLAMMIRQTLGIGCVIDLVGYRRHGHNEGDEPRFTQPTMYQRIDDHPTVRELYADRLVEEGVVSRDDVEEWAQSVYDNLVSIQEKLKEEAEEGDEGQEPDRITGAFLAVTEPETAVEESALRRINSQLVSLPEGFNLNRKLKKVFEKREKAFDEDGSIDWGHAESLAFGSLLREGVPIRMSGQDSERGTFSHRHAVLHDSETGEVYIPLRGLPDLEASFELYNSPLSEYSVLGFEYGVAVADTDALVLWEAQFGDFVNGAEVIIDQFIIAGLAKWGQTSRLTLLLPHGYEGQGPEHSSGRIERFLALGAEGNIRVANCSTPSQYFHLLRRQALVNEIRPLVLFTPKSLLRLPRAASSLAELTQGQFLPVLDDDELPGNESEVRRLVFCSGKVYYDVSGAEQRAEAGHVAIARIELLYPFPDDDVRYVISRYPNIEQIAWLQEEPRNMGARKWVVPRLEELAPDGVRVHSISRAERSSPAEGYPAMHKVHQQELIEEALQ